SAFTGSFASPEERALRAIAVRILRREFDVREVMKTVARANPLDVVRLSALMERSQGRPELIVALIDGPVALDHPDLARATVLKLPSNLPGKPGGACSLASSVACMHGTFVAGILCARRGSAAPG